MSTKVLIRLSCWTLMKKNSCNCFQHKFNTTTSSYNSHSTRNFCVQLNCYASSSSSPLPIVTLDSSSTETFNFGLFSNASNDSDSDESVDLFPTFNSLDDFFSPWIPDDVLPDFCSSLDDFHIATPDPLYEYSNFLLTCVLFLLYISCFLKHHRHLPCYTSRLM